MNNGSDRNQARCGEIRDLLPLLAAGPVEAAEAGAIQDHLDEGCPGCAAELAALRAAADMLPWSLPSSDPSPAVRERLMRRIKADSRPAIAPAPGAAPVTKAEGVPRRWLAAAAILAAALGSLLTATVMGSRHSGEIASLLNRLDRQSVELAALGNQIREARDAIRLASAPGVRIVNLAGQLALQTASARIFWDPDGAGWRLYGHQVPALPRGRTYQLWLITPTRKISAGTFGGGAAEALGAVRVPGDAGPIVAAAVTDEPAGGSPQPTGSILLLGQI